MDAQSYIGTRNELLAQCLRLTEDIYSGVNGDAETLLGLIDRRMETIEALRKLDDDAGETKNACPAETLAQSDAKLRLIQSLDEKIEREMRDAQRKLLDAMQSNVLERKFAGYVVSAEAEKGRRLDEKN
jgi:hypothetical protein